MKLAIVVLICCALVAQGQAQNRPSFFTRVAQAITQFFTRRPSGGSAAAAAAASSSSGSLTEASFSDPSILAAIQQQQEQVQQQIQQQIQPEIITRTVSLTETSTIISTVPSFERLTSIESHTETVTETVKVTEVMTNHVTMTITETDCPKSPIVATFKDAIGLNVISLSATPVAAVARTQKAKLAPYVVKRAIEIEASSL